VISKVVVKTVKNKFSVCCTAAPTNSETDAAVSLAPVRAILNIELVGTLETTPGDSISESRYQAPIDVSSSDNLYSIYWNRYHPENCYYNAPWPGDLKQWIDKIGEPIFMESCPSAF